MTAMITMPAWDIGVVTLVLVHVELTLTVDAKNIIQSARVIMD